MKKKYHGKITSLFIVLFMVLSFFGLLMFFMLQSVEKLGMWSRMTGIDGMALLSKESPLELNELDLIKKWEDMIKELPQSYSRQEWNNLSEMFHELHSENPDLQRINELRKYALEDFVDLQNFLEKEIPMQWRSIKFLLLLFFLITALMLSVTLLHIYDTLKSETHEELDETYQNKMIEQLEEERNTLAYHLHDEMAQALVFLKTYLESENPYYLKSKKNKAIEMTSELLGSVRNLSQSLRAPNRKEGSSQDILQGLCEDMKDLCPLDLDYQFIGMNRIYIQEKQLLHIYRITQELINNGCKHSQGKKMELRFLLSHPNLIISYSDDGIGLKKLTSMIGTSRDSIGIPGIEYRTKLLKGNCFFYSTAQEGGAKIRIEIPLGEEL
ncbi:MAG: histidine kinase [Spirochaetaceae bacterium]|jgi:signal transduction histidine kinase|nr:histidine kinase [Spirochaetaceae bacterium]